MTSQLFYLFKAPGNLFSQTAFYYSSVSHRMRIYSCTILGGTECDDLSVIVRNWGAMCCYRSSSFRNKTISKHNCGPFALEKSLKLLQEECLICPELSHCQELFQFFASHNKFTSEFSGNLIKCMTMWCARVQLS